MRKDSTTCALYLTTDSHPCDSQKESLMSDPRTPPPLHRWQQQDEDVLLYTPQGEEETLPDPVPVQGRRMWDATLVAWLLALADQGMVTAADRTALLVEGSDADMLAVGQLLRYFREELGWPVATYPATLTCMCEGLTVVEGIEELAYLWRKQRATWVGPCHP